MRRGAVLLCAACACHTSSNTEGPAAVVDAGSGTGSGSGASAAVTRLRMARADAGVDPLCAKILAEEKLDDAALREDRTSDGPRVRCFPDGKFAWAIRADRLEAGTSIEQTILFASDGGARARLASKVDGVEWPPVVSLGAYDFDGDGVPELVATIAKDVRTYAPASHVFVTVKNGAIVPYATGGGYQVDKLRDLDHDGRPDLIVSFDLGKRAYCAPTDEGRVVVRLAAHSLPGGKFSLDDPVATAFARRRCDRGALFSPSIDPSSDERDLSIEHVACERLHGKPADAVVAEIQSACAPFAAATKKCGGPCRHLPDALAVAHFAPPLELAPRDAGAR